VREHAEEIDARLADGTMPCASPGGELGQRFRQWIDAGVPE
jgi:hypothetical protein